MSESGQGDDDAELHARLARLDQSLRAHEEAKIAAEAPDSGSRKGFGRAMTVGLNAFSEFVGAIVVGALIGWQADVWLGTKPWLLVLFLGLGTAAGFWNVYRVAKPGAGSGEEQSN